MPGDDQWSRPDLNRGLGLPTFEHGPASGWSLPGWARGVRGALVASAAVLLAGAVVVALVR